MVNYLPSSAFQSIRVMPLEIGTRLTLVAVDQVIQGVTFPMAGVLNRVDTGAALEGETINASYDGTVIGSTVTSATGAYSFNVAIPDVGDYMLLVSFEGSTRPGFVLGASRSLSDMMITGLEIPALIMGLVAPILVGGTLAYLSK